MFRSTTTRKGVGTVFNIGFENPQFFDKRPFILRKVESEKSYVFAISFAHSAIRPSSDARAYISVTDDRDLFPPTRRYAQQPQFLVPCASVYLRMCTRGNPTSAVSLAETFSGKLHPDQYVRAWLVYIYIILLYILAQ